MLRSLGAPQRMTDTPGFWTRVFLLTRRRIKV
jgi:hypothetical protein